MLDFPSTGLVAGVTTVTGPSGQEWMWDGVKWTAVGGGGGGGGGLDENAVNDLIAAALATYTPPLPSPTTGTGNWVRGTAPTINQPVIMGVTDGSSAIPGQVGEIVSAEDWRPYQPAGNYTLSVTPPIGAGTWLMSSMLTLQPDIGATVTAARFNVDTPGYSMMTSTIVQGANITLVGSQGYVVQLPIFMFSGGSSGSAGIIADVNFTSPSTMTLLLEVNCLRVR